MLHWKLRDSVYQYRVTAMAFLLKMADQYLGTEPDRSCGSVPPATAGLTTRCSDVLLPACARLAPGVILDIDETSR